MPRYAPRAIRRGTSSAAEYFINKAEAQRKFQEDIIKEYYKTALKSQFEPKKWEPTTLQEALAVEAVKSGQYRLDDPEVQTLLTPETIREEPEGFEYSGEDISRVLEEAREPIDVGLGRTRPITKREEIPIVTPRTFGPVAPTGVPVSPAIAAVRRWQARQPAPRPAHEAMLRDPRVMRYLKRVPEAERPSIVEPVRRPIARPVKPVAKPEEDLRQRAIKALEDAGYPITEANITAAMKQMR